MGKKDFERKKVGSLTLGEQLLALRKDHHVTIHEFVKHTRIQKKYVEALESGDYAALPSQVYVRGFIHAYENYFSLAHGMLTKSLDREYQIYENINHKGDHDENVFSQKSSIPQIFISPRMIFASVIAIFIASIGVYAYSGARQFVSAPFIEIASPQNGSLVETPTTVISGTTHPEAFLYLNEAPVAVDVDGTFSEEVGLSEGENTFYLRSEGKAGKKTERKLLVVSTFVVPELVEEKQEDATVPAQDTVTVTVQAIDGPVWLRVVSDEVGVFDKTVEEGTIENFEASEKILLMTGRGNAIRVEHNGKDFGVLSEKEEIVKDVIFGRDFNTLSVKEASESVLVLDEGQAKEESLDDLEGENEPSQSESSESGGL